jgi:hypothetical protein
MTTLSVKAAVAIAGTLSKPSKMPGRGYSIPTAYCGVGGKLRDVKGSTCEHCYAHKRGNYRFHNVQAGLENRYRSLMHPQWCAAMAALITAQSPEYFRWHDSGDIQGPWHLANICEVARLTPNTRHWLPTREYRMVKQYLASGGTIPENLCVRLSAHMVDGSTPDIAGLPVSTVHTAGAPTGCHSCPALMQGNVCGECRACWRKDVAHVSYHVH